MVMATGGHEGKIGRMKLRIRGVTFSYGSIPALNDVSIEVEASEVLGIVGPNGAGKSTLLRCINRILKPQRGAVLLDGADVSGMSMLEVARRMGYVPQNSPMVFPTTVFDVVLMGRRPHLSWRCSADDVKKVLEVLKALRIEDLAMRDFTELSGGQQQKVLIARALAQEPEVLLLDEPTSNLDVRHQLEVMELLRTLADEKKLVVVMAIHDLNLAARFADKIVMLNAGRIFAAGKPADVLTPKNISRVYGVDAVVSEVSGKPFILPLKPV